MAFFSFVAAFLLAGRLRKTIRYSPLKAKWDGLLKVVLVASVAAFIGSESAFGDIGSELVGSLVLLGIVVYLVREPDFKTMLPYIEAHYPLIGATFVTAIVELISNKFYEQYDVYFECAIVGAAIWIFARLASTKKQQEEFRMVSDQNRVLDKLVAERTAELTQQKNELEETLKLLQTTQQQLIQSEKLASLGELTAGIAHEIQNPLNFVNNFAEVSLELVDEMEAELNKGDAEEAMLIANDIKDNLAKISQHGRRADGIVKGMLQHSRASSDSKEPTDINKLADEYLRLAYHGLRAKDKSFNAEMVTHFDETLPMISVVHQDIGRVLLNLFNNAFYAVNEKKKTAGDSYKPTVTVSTAASPSANGGWEISVKDNGTGIPDKVKDKIMQPFFTTKPAGEGTGLGLSLSYDIVVKGHGGTIDIKTEEGNFTEFILFIPRHI